MYKAEDIMTKNVLTVRKETALYDAMSMMVHKKISGLPVVDEDYNFLGLITEKDMLAVLEKVNDIEHYKVKDFMTKNIVTASPDITVIEICHLLYEKPFRRIPIVKDGKLCGIVSRRDIISIMLSIRSEGA